jgi:membrane protein implicated in regulation of membrane protease activity
VSGESEDGHRLPGVAVWLIAAGCAAYWLARAGVLATTWAVIAGVAAAVVVLAAAARRRARRRRELLGRLAGAMRAAAEDQRQP